VQLVAQTGELQDVINLPFRPGQIVPLSASIVAILSADQPRVALVDVLGRHVISDDMVDLTDGLFAVKIGTYLFLSGGGGVARYSIFLTPPIHLHHDWTKVVVPGYLNRMRLFGSHILVSTCGSMASPNLNQICLMSVEGEVLKTLEIDWQRGGSTLDDYSWGGEVAGIRDMQVADIDGDRQDEIIAISDNSYLYIWRPTL